jgi:hemoglobin-like flavoprotein
VTDDLVLATLERAAEKAGDIAPDVYRRWYAHCPASRAVMSHVDEYMQGRMMAEVLRLVLTPALDAERSYLKFETQSHAAYGVRPEMYGPLLEALRDTVREVLASEWTADVDRAWRTRLDSLLAEIAAAC